MFIEQLLKSARLSNWTNSQRKHAPILEPDNKRYSGTPNPDRFQFNPLTKSNAIFRKNVSRLGISLPCSYLTQPYYKLSYDPCAFDLKDLEGTTKDSPDICDPFIKLEDASESIFSKNCSPSSCNSFGTYFCNSFAKYSCNSCAPCSCNSCLKSSCSCGSQSFSIPLPPHQPQICPSPEDDSTSSPCMCKKICMSSSEPTPAFSSMSGTCCRCRRCCTCSAAFGCTSSCCAKCCGSSNADFWTAARVPPIRPYCYPDCFTCPTTETEPPPSPKICEEEEKEEEQDENVYKETPYYPCRVPHPNPCCPCETYCEPVDPEKDVKKTLGAKIPSCPHKCKPSVPPPCCLPKPPTCISKRTYSSMCQRDGSDGDHDRFHTFHDTTWRKQMEFKDTLIAESNRAFYELFKSEAYEWEGPESESVIIFNRVNQTSRYVPNKYHPDFVSPHRTYDFISPKQKSLEEQEFCVPLEDLQVSYNIPLEEDSESQDQEYTDCNNCVDCQDYQDKPEVTLYTPSAQIQNIMDDNIQSPMCAPYLLRNRIPPRFLPQSSSDGQYFH